MSQNNQQGIPRYFLRNNQEKVIPENQDALPKTGGKNSTNVTPIQPTASDPAAGNTNNSVDSMASSDETVSNSELKSLILRLEKSLSDRLCKLEGEISSLKDTQTENRDRIDGLNHDVEQVKNDIGMLREGEVAALKHNNQLLTEKLTLMEIHNRKMNLLFYGVEQNPGENVHATLRKCLKDDFGLSEEEAANVDLAHAHRLPSRRPRQGPDPIIARFVYVRDVDEILDRARNRPFMRDRKPASVYTDLPPEMKQIRGRLAEKARELRQQGNQTRIRVIGTKVLLEYRVRHRREGNTGSWTQYKD